ncbi:2-Hydroxyacid oxidase 1 [Salmo salar]|uniref:(S)-2-hydroxy-acid oxidase n=2 Tax=Salmo salar TaxID=8030 RepID=B5X381_SALSA|nr:hydroxyacid oxidase 1 [Salmo salar]ACI33762.1 Hydroxyacid oxidase 1 [Salmo salar]|eukprot:NP_001135240.1 hydroxyacid oxidase 1 [Salmo salar]
MCVSLCVCVVMSEKLVCVADYESMAKRVLPKAVFDYYCSGADQQETLADNTAAFSRWLLFPRVLRDVSSVDLSVSVLGQRISMPVCVGATAMQRMAHPDGETATARATRAAGTGMMLSSWATSTIEEVRSSAGDGLLWMQLYIYKDRDLTLSLVRRAEEAGYKAIFVTVDTPYLGKRRDDVRNRFKLPPHLKMTNFGSAELAFSSAEGYGEDSGLAVYVAQAIDPTLCWEHIAWLKKNTHLPVVVKGVLRAEDALEALIHGVDGILVSNHGARQLDGVPATLDVLSEVVSAVAGRCEVYLDGGVRRGTDVLKALALGATAVFLGRPVLWGLACQGEQGVSDVLELMRDELHLAMALAGCCSVAEVNRSLVRRPEFTSRI